MHFKKLQQFTFLFLLATVSVAFLWVIHDFLMPIFWALVFGIIFYPIQRKLVRRTNKPNLSSILTILFILILFFVPLFIIGGLVFQESLNLYQAFNTSGNISFDLIERFGESLGYLEQFGVSELEAKEKMLAYTSVATKWLASQAVSFGGRTFIITLQFFLMIYILFFMLRDGRKIEKRLIEILPLGDKREKRLFSKFTSTTRAVIKGTLVVGIVQGAIGGLLFSIAGIGGAVLWGVLMTILSVIPALGAAIVWLPAGIVLLLTGSVWQGIMVIFGGILIISLVDNILRPILIGKDTKMPDAFILISTLGGLSIFGITGFVIGPVLAGFFIAMWSMFEEEYHIELLNHG